MDKKIDKLFSDQKAELTDNLKNIQQLHNLSEKYKLEKQDQFLELIIGIIEVIDTFEKSEEAINERNLNADENSQKIINRFTSVLKKLHKLLQKNGVTKLEFPENRLMIGFCKVIDTEPDSNLTNDTIIEVVRSGYIHGKELIREAEVIIVKN
jgi:molecular chaperone GrpE (heat shock protein)